ncbi:DUF2085 domain-containing protein [Candidatus Micrarchaeota archaeon]|nr:DUF2085 domain-containing protein [Candidatus Micrarchaeota archaeon]
MKTGYIIYILLMGILAIPTILVPVFMNQSDVFSTVHEIYSPLCHQLASRSYCYFPEKGSFEDCFEEGGFSSSKEKTVEKNGGTGYKLPICSRDIGLYWAALLSGMGVFFTKWKNEKMPPPAIWFILAIIPLGIDGTGQLFGLWESTNTIRLITGVIAGCAVPFYMVPMFNTIFEKVGIA